MLADFDFSKLNTWILGGFGILGTFAGFGSLLASFRSRSLKTALEGLRASNEALKTELEASSQRGDRIEKERDEYREKLHEANGSLHACQIDNAELKVKTDFTPVMAFNKTWYEEQTKVSREMLQMLSGMTTLLEALNAKLEVARTP